MEALEWQPAAGGYTAFIATLRFIGVQALDKLYRQKFSRSYLLLNGQTTWVKK